MALSAVFLMAAAAPALAASPPVMMMRDAREQTPAALLGAWKVVPPAATPAGPRSQVSLVRTFQYTAEGRLLVNFINVRADGSQSIGHWALQVDGSPGYEYRNDNGSTPIAEIRFKKVDDLTFELTNSVAGEVEASSVWKLSADGKSLTATRTPKGGIATTTAYVRWDGR